jgi:hypothetical protein
MPDNAKTRARTLILSHIAQFSLQKRMSDGTLYGGLSDMAFVPNDTPPPGALVALQSAPPSKWYLSWLIERSNQSRAIGEIYLLESIEDGELCEWSNVSLLEYDRRQTDAHPEWRWSDAQHVFNDRWLRVCRKERDAYTVLPVQAEFEHGTGVWLSTRTRYGLDDFRASELFPNWARSQRK